MNKKEINELKKQLTPGNCNITKIATCLVNHEKEIIQQQPETFLLLPEEEMFKYMDLLRKSFSGKIGTNLYTVTLPAEDGSYQAFMDRLLYSGLKDPECLDQFYHAVAESYDFGEDYLIILIHGVYDIPGKTENGEEMFDASDEVYEYIHCILCPVKLSEPGLSYDLKMNSVKDRIRDRLVNAPINGFLFPAFQDRTSDVNALLFYCRKDEDEQPGFLRRLFGAKRPLCNKEKEGWLKEEMESLLMDNANFGFSELKNWFSEYRELLEENSEKNDMVDGKDLKKLAKKAGMAQEQAEQMEKDYSREIGELVTADGFLDTKALSVKTPAFQIKADPEYVDHIHVKKINGRMCVVLELDSNRGEVNGIETLLLEKADPQGTE